MSYKVKFGTVESELFGYLFVQPFWFAGGVFRRDPAHARVIAGIHHVSSETELHPSVSEGLPAPGTAAALAITNTAAAAVLNVSNMVMQAILPQQSLDVALTYWILEGSNASTIVFDPPCAFNYPPGGANYYPWKGSLTGNGADLAITTVSSMIEAKNGKYIQEFSAVGPANVNGAGTSTVKFVCAANSGANLPGLTFDDKSRKTTTLLFDSTPDGVTQVNGGTARGAVFAYNGTFSRWAPTDVLWVVRNIVEAQQPGVASPRAWLIDPTFWRFPQSTDAAARHSGWRQADYAQFGENFEGLTVWGLSPRGATYRQPLMF
jgi:hypothetical protein